MKLSMHLHQLKSAILLGTRCLWVATCQSLKRFKNSSLDLFESYRSRIFAPDSEAKPSSPVEQGLVHPKPSRPVLLHSIQRSDDMQTCPDLTRSNTPPSIGPQTPSNDFFSSLQVTLIDFSASEYTVECHHEGVPYLAKIIKNKNRFEVDYDDASIQQINRQRFIAHTKNLVMEKGMQAARPQLLAAAQIFDVQIRVWSPSFHDRTQFSLQDIVAPKSSDTEKFVDLLLFMHPGDASHFQPFQGPLTLEQEGFNYVGKGQKPIESGAEGECFYFSIMWYLDQGNARALRTQFESEKQQISYVQYFTKNSDLLKNLHAQIGQELSKPEYIQAINGEIRDSLGIQLKDALTSLNRQLNVF